MSNTNFTGAYTRRQEMVADEAEFKRNADKVLLKNEVLYVRCDDGTVRQLLGDGITPIKDLPRVVFINPDIEGTLANAVQELRGKTDASLAEVDAAKQEMLGEIEAVANIVQTMGDSETAVMSQKATTDAIKGLVRVTVSDECLVFTKGANVIDETLIITTV